MNYVMRDYVSIVYLCESTVNINMMLVFISMIQDKTPEHVGECEL